MNASTQASGSAITKPDPQIHQDHQTRRTVGHRGAADLPPGRRQCGRTFRRRINAELPNIQKRCRPASICDVIYDRAWTHRRTVSYDVQTTLVIAFVLVVLVIFIFLGRATDTLIPVVALPLSLLLTFIAMNMLGYSLDNLSLMALTLAIGFLVDDAIVFLENVVRRMEKFGESPVPAQPCTVPRKSASPSCRMTVSLAAVFHPAGVAVRLDGPNLPRVLRHDRDRDFRQRHCLADTHPADVRPHARQPAGMAVRRPGWSASSAASSTACWTSTATRSGSSCGIAGSRPIIWVCCLGGTYLLFIAVPKSFLPVG